MFSFVLANTIVLSPDLMLKKIATKYANKNECRHECRNAIFIKIVERYYELNDALSDAERFDTVMILFGFAANMLKGIKFNQWLFTHKPGQSNREPGAIYKYYMPRWALTRFHCTNSLGTYVELTCDSVGGKVDVPICNS